MTLPPEVAALASLTARPARVDGAERARAEQRARARAAREGIVGLAATLLGLLVAVARR